MSRIHGRNGRVYMAIASGATAEPVSFVARWSIDFAYDMLDVTYAGSTMKSYTTDRMEVSGEFAGYSDDATAQTYTAAVDGVPRKFYLYPNSTSLPGEYWWGTILPDFQVNAAIDGAAEFSAKWKAASQVSKVEGSGGGGSDSYSDSYSDTY